MANIFDTLVKKASDAAVGFAKKNQALVDTVANLTPQGRAIGWAKTITLGIVITICIILLVVSIVMFNKKSTTAGIFLLGASIMLSGYTLWMYQFSRNNVNTVKGSNEYYDLSDHKSDNIYFEPDQME